MGSGTSNTGYAPPKASCCLHPLVFKALRMLISVFASDLDLSSLNPFQFPFVNVNLKVFLLGSCI